MIFHLTDHIQVVLDSEKCLKPTVPRLLCHFLVQNGSVEAMFPQCQEFYTLFSSLPTVPLVLSAVV